MITKQIILAGCAVMVLSISTASAGPCNTGDKGRLTEELSFPAANCRPPDRQQSARSHVRIVSGAAARIKLRTRISLKYLYDF
jgi:hypothetical protein